MLRVRGDVPPTELGVAIIILASSHTTLQYNRDMKIACLLRRLFFNFEEKRKTGNSK